MGCTHKYFEYEDSIHYAELYACPLSGAFPTCQHTEHHRDEHEEDCKQYRTEDTQEEVEDFASDIANPVKAILNALAGLKT